MNAIFMLLSELLKSINFVIGDWGLTIIAITMIMRICLMPVSFKQRLNMIKQQVLSKKIEEIKEKHKNDKQKLDMELASLSKESAKNMLGCLLTMIQLPVMYSLYRVFSTMPLDIGSAIVPWVTNLNLPDTYFIIPVISALVQLIPNILLATGIIRNMNLPKPTKGQMAITVIMNLIFLARAPVTIGIYWASSGLFSMLEQFLFSLYSSRKKLGTVN